MIYDFDELWKLVNRRNHLCKYPPLCARCRHEQVQLLDHFEKPATWKCRICKFEFLYEPPEDS